MPKTPFVPAAQRLETLQAEAVWPLALGVQSVWTSRLAREVIVLRSPAAAPRPVLSPGRTCPLQIPEVPAPLAALARESFARISRPPWRASHSMSRPQAALQVEARRISAFASPVSAELRRVAAVL